VENTKPMDLSELDARWKKVDSLEQKGLVASALEEVQKIKQSAIAHQHSGHLIKAVLYENKYQNQLEEDSSIKAIQRGEEEYGSYPEPAKSVMHSLLAQWYYNYLQSHLWQLRSTTEYTGPAGPDIRTWGIRHLVNKIQEHYQASVQWDGLKAAKVEDYLILLTDEKNTDALRPTLYDVLMHRALDFYSGSESFLTKPIYSYTLTDPAAFGEAKDFIKYSFVTADSLDNTWQALTWFQQLLDFRIKDQDHAAALLDADLKRLQFVYDHIVVDGKDSLFQTALEQLASRNQKSPESSLVNYYIAQLWMQQASQWQADHVNKYKDNYIKAKALCENSMKAYPDAYGSQLCGTLIKQIEQKSISAAVESISLPGEELLAKLDYRNINLAYVKIVKLPEAPRRWKNDTWEGEKILSRLNQLTPIKSWSQALKGSEDYQPHVTEFGLPVLEAGHYALVIADQEKFDPKSSTTGTLLFTVSELAYWFLDDRKDDQVVAVMNRRTGQPTQGVKVEFFSMEYNSSLRKQEEVKLGEGISDAKGWVDSPNRNNQSLSLRLTKDKDELYTDDSYYTYRYGGESSNQPSTLFFSDRSIYRPGQKFYFKGYAVEFNSKAMPSIVADKNVEVILYDANGKEVSKKNFVSNAYGTFSGQFDLPQGGLGGQMYVTSSYGASRYYFQVEEYKRPKFEVTFDTLKETVRLDEIVNVKAISKDYAGSPVSGAKVGFRVERVSFQPWWYGYWRKFAPGADDRQVLAVGQGMTTEDGSINISFPAKSKPGSDANLMYHFEITVIVTDITGESHEATKTLVLNKQGYEVGIKLDNEVSISDLKEIEISATNSDGAKVNVTGTVEISQLAGPVVNKRDRLWDVPDVITISEQDYQARFPNYFIPGKEDKSTWPVNKTTGSKTFNINGTNKVELAALINQPGYYRLNWKWKDDAGKELMISQNIMVFAPGQSLPAGEVFLLDWKDQPYEPGQSVKVDLLSGIANPPSVIQLTEHRISNSSRRWVSLPLYNDQPITISEDDRGGMIMNYLVVYNNRFHQSLHVIQVPWSNKDLKVELKTWRDKMEPGNEETWTISVSGQKGEQVTAEMLMSMYDASLDAFIPHQWSMSLYPSIYSRYMIQGAEAKEVAYWGLTYHWDQNYQDVPYRQYRELNTYGYFPEGNYYPGRSRGGDYDKAGGVMVMQAAESAPSPKDGESAKKMKDDVGGQPSKSLESAQPVSTAPPPLRSALDETVFFYPQLMTDATGKLTFNFKMKEGLTRWKFQALAHTKELAYGFTKEEVVTQKQLMVFPNPPRFFRAGDTIDFQIKIANLSPDALSGISKLTILDAFTNEDVSSKWKMTSNEKQVQIKTGGSTPVSWTLQVPLDWTRPVKYQVYAKAGNLTDGEEALLPVVTNRVLITETLPLPIKSNETRTFIFKSMQDQHSNTLVNHQYVVEMTSSPAWYAVQALPYLMEYPHECAEQTFSRLYANTLASYIANKYPAIKQVYDAWRQTGDDALLSNLEKNQDLKSAMLEETPWVRDAMGETMQKKDIALLFEPNRLSMETKQALDRLRDLQMSNGGFPWFPGGQDNWYITQYIVEGFGHLQKMGVALKGDDSYSIVQKAVPYIDARMIEWYDELKRLANAGKLKMDDHQISGMQVHYLYTRSFYPEIQHTAKLDEVINYVKSQMEKYWLEHGIYDQGLMALGSFRTWPNEQLSKDILASLRQRTIVNDELGRYWKIPSGYYWNESPIEMQSLMIELYQDMKVPQAETDELRVWLLKQKQTTQWKTTKATAAAIYALLIHPDTWLTTTGIVEVKLGGKSVINAASEGQAGIGYVKKSWSGNEIQNNWSTLEVSNPNNHIAWGSAYWQFWEDLDKVKSTVDNNPLKVTRTLLIAQNTDRGAETVMASGRHLHVGDKLIVRLTVETDRAMDFVHLKDLRASGFEPMDVISGYHWSGGIGYYQSTKDLATHFFIDHLPRGKFVIEYPVTVAQAGSYSEGLATLQCMYAPEFSDHSAGSRVSATMN
jgi:hypothetical protein